MAQSDAQPVALVTGAGAARIGQCIAQRLADDGFQLAIHAHRSIEAARTFAADLSENGSPSIAVAADIADESAVKRMIAQVVDRYGRIDALVNSAAIWEENSLEDTSAADVMRHLQINTLGTFTCCQQVGLQMVSQDHGGNIVNIGDWAIARPYRNYSAYLASKGSIPAMTRTFAAELAQRNPLVRVNAVLPGPVMLPADMPEDEKRLTIAGTLVKREGRPHNVADAVAFLIGNDYVTGVCLPVDGGRTIYYEP